MDRKKAAFVTVLSVVLGCVLLMSGCSGSGTTQNPPPGGGSVQGSAK